MNKQEYKKQQRQTRLDDKPEIWKDVIGYEGLYKVSNLGRIKSLNYGGYTKEERILKISNACKLKYKQCGGFIWSYFNN